MRPFPLFAALAVLFLTAAACTKVDPEPVLPDYTVMLYAVGGGNLDSSMLLNLKQAIHHGRTSNVDMVCELKLSKSFKQKVDVGTMAGTVRMEIGEKMDTTGIDLFSYPTIPAGGDDVRLDDPGTLSEFIRWTCDNHPARNYVLVLWDHGNGWEPRRDTLRTRALMMDDNTSFYMTQESLVEGIRGGGVHLKLIYEDLCMMGLFECLCDYAEVADYHLGCCEATPSLGGDYDAFLEALDKAGNSDEGLQTSLSAFSRTLGQWWIDYAWTDPTYAEDEEASDIGWVDLRKLPQLTSVVGRITEELCTTYDKYTEAYDKATSAALSLYSGLYFVDAGDYFSKLGSLSGNARLQSLSDEFDTALAQAQYRVTSHPAWEDSDVSVSIGLVMKNKDEYVKRLAKSDYFSLAFDKQTHWSDWMKTNNVSITGNADRRRK